MTKATSIVASQIKKDESKEFISVHQFEKEFWRDVPINLVAAQEAAETCLQ
jgi:hypothetical protein